MPAPVKKLIKLADHACAFFEATQLVVFSDAEARRWFDQPPAGYDLVIAPLAPAAASAAFVARFEALLARLNA